MRNDITAVELDIVNNQKVNTYHSLSKKSEDYIENNPVFGILTTEGCENFLNLNVFYKLGI